MAENKTDVVAAFASGWLQRVAVSGAELLATFSQIGGCLEDVPWGWAKLQALSKKRSPDGGNQFNVLAAVFYEGRA